MNISRILLFLFLRKEKISFALLMVVALIGGVYAFPLSYVTNSNEFIGLCLIPFVVTVRGSRRFNYLFLTLIVLFGFGSYVYGVRMFYFFALAFYALWLTEFFFGRVSILAIFLIGFMSPFFYQVSAILGFPIRLQLSQLAGDLLKGVGENIQVEGNMMLLNGTTFTVDDACMGLNMLAISMLMGVFILAHNCRVKKKALKLSYMIIFFSSAFALNLVANLFRIIILVLFAIVPENPAHEIIGIICLCVYALIPLYILGHRMVDRAGHELKALTNTLSISVARKLALPIVAFSLMWIGVNLNDRKAHATATNTLASLPGYKVTEIGDGVTKFTNGDILIYIKPIQEFFTGEHTPLLCWKGSGYSFSCISTSEMGGKQIYYGQLVKEKEKLFTVWWYTNGKIQTISQLDWRWRMMKGEEKFSLVNVTSNDEGKLLQNVRMILEKDPLNMRH